MNPEDEAHLVLEMDGGEFTMTRHNSTLFTFFGKLAMYNHVFLETGDDEETMMGTYLFENGGNDAYEHIVTYMEDNEFPSVLSQNEVAECDKRAFERMALRDLENSDYVPDGWV